MSDWESNDVVEWLRLQGVPKQGIEFAIQQGIDGETMDESIHLIVKDLCLPSSHRENILISNWTDVSSSGADASVVLYYGSRSGKISGSWKPKQFRLNEDILPRMDQKEEIESFKPAIVSGDVIPPSPLQTRIEHATVHRSPMQPADRKAVSDSLTDETMGLERSFSFRGNDESGKSNTGVWRPRHMRSTDNSPTRAAATAPSSSDLLHNNNYKDTDPAPKNEREGSPERLRMPSEKRAATMATVISPHSSQVLIVKNLNAESHPMELPPEEGLKEGNDVESHNLPMTLVNYQTSAKSSSSVKLLSSIHQQSGFTTQMSAKEQFGGEEYEEYEEEKGGGEGRDSAHEYVDDYDEESTSSIGESSEGVGDREQDEDEEESIPEDIPLLNQQPSIAESVQTDIHPINENVNIACHSGTAAALITNTQIEVKGTKKKKDKKVKKEKNVKIINQRETENNIKPVTTAIRVNIPANGNTDRRNGKDGQQADNCINNYNKDGNINEVYVPIHHSVNNSDEYIAALERRCELVAIQQRRIELQSELIDWQRQQLNAQQNVAGVAARATRSPGNTRRYAEDKNNSREIERRGRLDVDVAEKIGDKQWSDEFPASELPESQFRVDVASSLSYRTASSPWELFPGYRGDNAMDSGKPACSQGAPMGAGELGYISGNGGLQDSISMLSGSEIFENTSGDVNGNIARQSQNQHYSGLYTSDHPHRSEMREEVAIYTGPYMGDMNDFDSAVQPMSATSERVNAADAGHTPVAGRSLAPATAHRQRFVYSAGNKRREESNNASLVTMNRPRTYSAQHTYKSGDYYPPHSTAAPTAKASQDQQSIGMDPQVSVDSMGMVWHRKLDLSRSKTAPKSSRPHVPKLKLPHNAHEPAQRPKAKPLKGNNIQIGSTGTGTVTGQGRVYCSDGGVISPDKPALTQLVAVISQLSELNGAVQARRPITAPTSVNASSNRRRPTYPSIPPNFAPQSDIPENNQYYGNNSHTAHVAPVSAVLKLFDAAREETIAQLKELERSQRETITTGFPDSPRSPSATVRWTNRTETHPFGPKAEFWPEELRNYIPAADLGTGAGAVGGNGGCTSRAGSPLRPRSRSTDRTRRRKSEPANKLIGLISNFAKKYEIDPSEPETAVYRPQSHDDNEESERCSGSQSARLNITKPLYLFPSASGIIRDGPTYAAPLKRSDEPPLYPHFSPRRPDTSRPSSRSASAPGTARGITRPKTPKTPNN